MSRDLLRRALDALEECRLADYRDFTLTDDIREELEKPDIDDSLTAAFMLGYESAKNDYGRKE